VPDTYRMKFSTNKGDFTVDVTKSWSLRSWRTWTM
jgi:hypothetical protein